MNRNVSQIRVIANFSEMHYNTFMFKDGDKRKFFRHPIHSPLKIQINRQEEVIATKIHDISLGGLSFLWESKLSKGAMVSLFISVKEKFFEIKGRVAYSIHDARTGRYRNGVIFADSPSAFKAKLAEEALQILKYRQKLSRELGRQVSEEEAADLWIAQFASEFPA